MGLVYLSEPLSFLIKKYCTLIHSPLMIELITTTLAAYFSTLPYVMFAFGSVSVYALIANIIVVPFVPLAMMLSFLVVISSYVSTSVATVLGLLDSVLIDLMIRVASMIESLPFSSISLTVSFKVMIMLYLIILLFVKYARVSFSNETKSTTIHGNLTGIISY
jgi:predicted membrane metal-binding protein